MGLSLRGGHPYRFFSYPHATTDRKKEGASGEKASSALTQKQRIFRA